MTRNAAPRGAVAKALQKIRTEQARKGGLARAKKLSKKRRSEIAREGALAANRAIAKKARKKSKAA